jgi:hypothetical protein
VAANGWPSARLPIWIHALAWEPTEGVLDAGLGVDEVPILERSHVTEHLRGESLMDFPQGDVVEGQVMQCEEPRDRVAERRALARTVRYR